MTESSSRTGWGGNDAMFGARAEGRWDDGLQYDNGFPPSPAQTRTRHHRNTYPPFEHLIRLELLLKNAIIPHLTDIDTDSTPLREMVPYYHSVIEKQQAGLLLLIRDCCRANDSAIRIIFGARKMPAEQKVIQILAQLSMQSLDDPAFKRWIGLRRFEDLCKNLQDHWTTPLLYSKEVPNAFRSYNITTIERFLQAMIAHTLFGWLRADLARLSELFIDNWERNLHNSFAGRYPAFGPRDVFKMKSQMVLMIRALPVLRHLQFITEYCPMSPAGYLQTRGRERSSAERKRIQVEFILPDGIQEVISYVTLRSIARGAPAVPIPPFWPEHEKELRTFLDAAEQPVHLATYDSKRPGHVDMKLSDNSSAQRFMESLSRVGKLDRDKGLWVLHWSRHIPPEEKLEYTGDEVIKWERSKEKRFRMWELKQVKTEEAYFGLPKVAKQMPQLSSIVSRMFKM